MRHHTYSLVVAAGLALAACGKGGDVAPDATRAVPASPPPATAPALAASLADGIAFANPDYPGFVARTEGISQPEPFGRWTDGPKAVIEFKEPLPLKFELVLQGAAYGPNIGQQVKVSIGAVTQELSFASDPGQEAQTHRLSFSLEQPANRIEFTIPRPTRPPNGDARALGIALVELKIEAAPK